MIDQQAEWVTLSSDKAKRLLNVVNFSTAMIDSVMCTSITATTTTTTTTTTGT